MKTIWIIDDDEEMIRALQLMLRLLDMETRYFLGARPAALELLAGKRPDLIILDVNMPEVNGIEMLDFLRKRKELKSLPVIMLSSEAAEVQAELAMEMGADSYVTKPVALPELEGAIKKAFKARSIEI